MAYVKQTGRKLDYAATSDWNVQAIAPVAGGKLRTYNFKANESEVLTTAQTLHAQYPRAKVHARAGECCWTWKP